MIHIQNNSQEIVASNFWDQPITCLALSVNAGCYRLLVPESKEKTIPDMLSKCDYAIVSTTANPSNNHYSLEIVFEDHSEAPYSIQMGAGWVLGLFPLPDKMRVERRLTVWIKGPRKIATFKAYNRLVPSLPWLKPLQ